MIFAIYYLFCYYAADIQRILHTAKKSFVNLTKFILLDNFANLVKLTNIPQVYLVCYISIAYNLLIISL